MPVNRKTEMFLQSLADVSRIHFQIRDLKGSLHFSTQANRSQQPDAAPCLKCAKKVIASRTFVYAAPSPNRHLCGIPIGLGNGTPGALLATGPIPDSDAGHTHPEQMERFLKQVITAKGPDKTDIPHPPQQENGNRDPRFEDLYLFANLTKQFRSLRIKPPVLTKLMRQMINDMRGDVAFLLLPEHPQYNQMEFNENRWAKNRKTDRLRQEMVQLVSQATEQISDPYCIINDSRDNQAFNALSGQPYRLMATGVRHLKNHYGWLGLVSYRMDDTFAMPMLDILQTMANQLAAMMANTDHYEDLERFTVNMVCSLVSAIEEKDAYAKGHSRRVYQYAMHISRHIGMSAEETESLKWASLLHDIGKIGIPEKMLNKPGKLTADEYELIKKHPMKGKTILEPIRQLAPALPAIAHHHEHYNGNGYPEGLKGEQIPLAARIIAVADTFDAIISSRSYHKPRSPREAMRVLDQVAGTQLDAHLVSIFKTVYRQLDHGATKVKKAVNA
jgi:HD-GYP domain-containing protein (c-di-GMP phosphodiesterase class II)